MKYKNTDHFSKITIDWLTAPDKHDCELEINDEFITYPLPKNAGAANANILKTSHQISLYQAKHDYNVDILGDRFKVGRFEGEFETPIFSVGNVFGSRSEHTELIPECHIPYGEGLSLFRHADKFSFDLFHETSQPFDTIFFSLPVHSLNLLIGKENTDYLMASLNISNSPCVVSRHIPYRLNQILKSAVSPHLEGRMKQLYSQAKVLEYLCELIEYIEQQKGLLPSKKAQNTTARYIYI